MDKIFIGASYNHYHPNKAKVNSCSLLRRKTTPLAKYLFERMEIDVHSYDMKPWWDENTIKPGVDFFKRLIDLSSICDFGIFILSNDHKDVSKNIYLSNDNVYIEMGMFIAKKGVDRTIFIMDKELKIPSDFSGLNVLKYDFGEERDFKKAYNHIIERIKDVKKNQKNKKNYNNFKLFLNHRTNNYILNQNETIQFWNSKLAYVGLDAAKVWYDIENNPNYLTNLYKSKFRKFLKKTVKPKTKNIKNVVSLGSGLGTLDQIIVRNCDFEAIKYIPIEINPYLAYKALDNITNNTQNIKESYAIIDDFETEISQLSGFISNNIVLKEEETLFTFLGGTFCNIDNPDTFLNEFSKLIDDNDYLLIDAFTINYKENCIADSNSDTYIKEDDLKTRLKGKIIKPLLIGAITNKFKSSFKFQNDENAIKFMLLSDEEKLDKLFDYVDVDPINSNGNFIFIFKFKIFKFKDDLSSMIYKVKRYSYCNLINKISDYYEIVEDGIERINISNGLDKTTIFCKYKNNTNE